MKLLTVALAILTILATDMGLHYIALGWLVPLLLLLALETLDDNK